MDLRDQVLLCDAPIARLGGVKTRSKQVVQQLGDIRVSEQRTLDVTLAEGKTQLLEIAGVSAQLLLQFVEQAGQPAWIGSLSMHVFTFGAMGLIIPAMLIRIANGHTGRKVVFDRLDKSVLWIMIAGFVFRIVLPQIDPAGYLRWISLAAACWFACFAILGWRYIPYLLQARVDGKEH